MQKELVLTIARALVDYPEEINVTEEEVDGVTVITLSAHKDDVGKVIGKNGKIASAIRAVLTAASKDRGKIRLNIAD
ncbi:hypothetical protein HNR44_001272 [Geomicrobium halophilum]|uniref:RNA-binding protein KhpA n=1 Tax=Geomicrobium halophilum TaxID=549000 RepID=A0A841PXT0_9BACL|nr:KH domain-containing protein [Geomicrobium halophilum]MBB6449323.1 hypothetical protein [Geomicrobium halophilum]